MLVKFGMPKPLDVGTGLVEDIQLAWTNTSTGLGAANLAWQNQWRPRCGRILHLVWLTHAMTKPNLVLWTRTRPRDGLLGMVWAAGS